MEVYTNNLILPSKRQQFYSLLSRNGFLFNFSATFTDPIDFATCAFNFNLEKFIQQGYGKHIYISQSDISALAKKEDFTETQKKVTILKVLLLHTYIKKQKKDISKYYHNPLILTLVNSVNTEDSDLYLFFREIVNIANKDFDNDVLSKAKQELLRNLNGQCEFDNEKIDLLQNTIDNLTYEDILEGAFNSNNPGRIEILKIPGNRQEIILKLATSDRPFALIKIGDISDWLKNKLNGYQIIERFDNESFFRDINRDNSDINILMGSRSFYEGWDSNRPNIILYINIGKGIDARKFVLQSIGRGVRVEPLPNKRKRLQFLYNNNEIDISIFNNLKDKVKFIETLFVFGTKVENLKEVIETLKEEEQEELIGDLFEINPQIKDKLLLIPTYKESGKLLVDERNTFPINKEDYDLIKNYVNFVDDKIKIVKYDCQPKVLVKIKDSLSDSTYTNYYKIDGNIMALNKPELIFTSILKHFSIHDDELSEFKKIENEIIHFKQIKISKDKANNIREKIEKIRNYDKKQDEINKLKNDLNSGSINLDQFTEKIQKLGEQYPEFLKEDHLHIKYLSKYYYIPILLSEDDNIIYIKHIIKVGSESKFVEDLEEYLKKDSNFFSKFDWWFFSKIDETLDEIYIPYYQPKVNKMEKFKPDFIFWMQKGNEYIILFVDPKGTEFSDAYRKIDGFKHIFSDESGKCKIFKYNEFSVKVCLLLKTEDISKVPQEYRQYWFDNLEILAHKIFELTKLEK
ncbi:restriction endonuclease subunit R [Athalassotoga saccharophila]|uniref:Type III restriction-modification system DNA endonuclease n=1 Tax=Athalassotoga saccharophila TaxID=1441386 RepID=A0A6N4TEG6_9BACT|nr:restriction endonuclease subunit R [Athalassotoga saccharophila]BBJ29127.1 type III restriction-modification system DNA endonuclease [Athalassotoga saccharophila]